MTISEADALAGGLSSIGIYMVMALVLLVKPQEGCSVPTG